MPTEASLTSPADARHGAPAEYQPPEPVSSRPRVPLPPDGAGYRLKRKLLGKPMHSEQLEHERLGKPTALAVFASDNLSSSAYATEEILHVLVPASASAAFALVMPITVRHAGGAGPADHQLPGDDQGVPVGRRRLPGHPRQLRHRARPGGGGRPADRLHPDRGRVGGGRQRRARPRPSTALAPYRVPLSLFFIALIAYGNLRGVRESGRIFAAPTFFFMVNMARAAGPAASSAT